MMSKERELLKRWLAGEANQIPTHVPLLIETQNLLAQPEALAPEREFIRLWYENIELWKVHAKEPEQEPEAWMLIDKETGARIPKAYKPEHGVNKDRWELYPLFASPPTRKPLIDGEIRDGLDSKNGFENWYDDRFVDGVLFAEKHHGIGGE